MRQLIKYANNYKKEFIIGPAFKLTEAVLELMVPIVMGKIIDNGIAAKDKSYVLSMGGLIIVIGITGLICALICQYMAAKASQGFGTQLRNDLFAKINALSHRELDKYGTAGIITRLTNDVNQLQVAVAMLIRLVVRAPFLVIGATIMATTINRKLSVIFVIIIPLVSLVLYFVMKKTIPFYKKIQSGLDKISSITRESIQGTRVIRAFSRQDTENTRFGQITDTHLSLSISASRISALLNPLITLILNVGIIAVLWFGGIQINSGSLSQGEIIAFVNYMTQISLELVVVANLVVIFNKAFASSSRITTLLNETSSITLQHSALSDTKNTNGNHDLISFNKVSFSYSQSGDPALSDISFSIPHGQTIGIIGGTGSGKSTLVNLIPRFYDPSSGSILFNGTSLVSIPVESLRNNIAIVPQSAALFSGTVAQNLRWGDINASDEQLDKALKIAQAYDFVYKLPENLNSTISEAAKNLSGGQKQRLTIARALVKNPQVLILDDSSSALDFATDAALRKSLSLWKNNQHVIIIVSQRTTSLQFCDQILVLDDGKLAAIGSHRQLLESSDIYKEIHSSQK